MPLTRRDALNQAMGLLAACAWPAVHAHSAYPAGPIRFIIPSPAGGGHDIMMRSVCAKLAEAWGEPAIVVSKAGASGAISTTYVAKSPPDGLTLLLGYSALLSNLVLHPDPGYKLGDLIPVCMLVLSPLALCVRTSLGVSTVAEFVELAKRSPRKLSYGSYGLGSGAHFIGAQINAAAGIELLHVPYKGEAPALQDLLGGEIDSAIVSVGGAFRYPEKVRPLAVASHHRFPTHKDMPTFIEAGLPSVNLPGWAAIFAPANTPMPIVDKLTMELNRIIMLPEMQAKMLELGCESAGWPPEKLTAFMNEQLVIVKRLVDEGRVRITS